MEHVGALDMLFDAIPFDAMPLGVQDLLWRGRRGDGDAGGVGLGAGGEVFYSCAGNGRN